MLPAQDELPEGGVGNLIALPLQGKALKEGNSAFIDSNWNAYSNQWEILWSKPRLSKEFLEAKIREWTSFIEDTIVAETDEDREKPWEKKEGFLLQMLMGSCILHCRVEYMWIVQILDLRYRIKFADWQR